MAINTGTNVLEKEDEILEMTNDMFPLISDCMDRLHRHSEVMAPSPITTNAIKFCSDTITIKLKMTILHIGKLRKMKERDVVDDLERKATLVAIMSLINETVELMKKMNSALGFPIVLGV